jgi:hypothetical protein
MSHHHAEKERALLQRYQTARTYSALFHQKQGLEVEVELRMVKSWGQMDGILNWDIFHVVFIRVSIFHILPLGSRLARCKSPSNLHLPRSVGLFFLSY